MVLPRRSTGQSFAQVCLDTRASRPAVAPVAKELAWPPTSGQIDECYGLFLKDVQSDNIYIGGMETTTWQELLLLRQCKVGRNYGDERNS